MMDNPDNVVTVDTGPAATFHAPQVLLPSGGSVQARAMAQNAMTDTIESLNIVREFIRKELVGDVDYGKVPGCGDRDVLLQPGAQKICMFLNVRPDYDVKRLAIPDHPDHVEYLI